MSRKYRDDVSMDVIDGFMQFLLEQENDVDMVPIIQYGEVTFIYTKNIDVYCESIKTFEN